MPHLLLLLLAAAALAGCASVSAGNVVGVITASLGSRSRDVPQNVNFALKADVARTFLQAAGVPIETSGGGRDLSVADIGEGSARSPSSSTASAKISA